MYETRPGKISVGKPGGTASKDSKTFKLTIPNNWVYDMGLDEDRKVSLTFDGKTIKVEPLSEKTTAQYCSSRLAEGHKILCIHFYDGQTLCSTIHADLTDRSLRVENHTKNLLKTAFGKNSAPTWEDFEDFLEERCVPRQRAGLREYLASLGLDEYDPLAIIQKTQGRMAEDDQWMEVDSLSAANP